MVQCPCINGKRESRGLEDHDVSVKLLESVFVEGERRGFSSPAMALHLIHNPCIILPPGGLQRGILCVSQPNSQFVIECSSDAQRCSSLHLLISRPLHSNHSIGKHAITSNRTRTTTVICGCESFDRRACSYNHTVPWSSPPPLQTPTSSLR